MEQGREAYSCSETNETTQEEASKPSQVGEYFRALYRIKNRDLGVYFADKQTKL